MRTTRKQVESAFKYFLAAIGGTEHAWTQDEQGRNRSTVGQYELDYAGPYGGYTVNKIVNEHGAVSRPFGHRRFKASEMYDVLHFAVAAVREAQGNAATGEDA